MAEYFKVEEMVRRNAPIISEYGDASSMESVLLGGLSGERQWMDLAANPESYVDRNCPPILFLSGTKDFPLCRPCILLQRLCMKPA